MVKEIFFHYSEFKGDLEDLQAGDDVEFTIKDRNVGSSFSSCSRPPVFNHTPPGVDMKHRRGKEVMFSGG